MLEQWTAQIEHIEEVVNFWCGFSMVCGVIGLVLSVACAVWVIINIKKEEKDV